MCVREAIFIYCEQSQKNTLTTLSLHFARVIRFSFTDVDNMIESQWRDDGVKEQASETQSREIEI